MRLAQLKSLLLSARQTGRRTTSEEITRAVSSGTIGIASLLQVTCVPQNELPSQCRVLVTGSVSSEHLQTVSSGDVFLMTKSKVAALLLSLHQRAAQAEETALVAASAAASTQLSLRSSEAPINRLLSSYSLQPAGDVQVYAHGRGRTGGGHGATATSIAGIVTLLHKDLAAKRDCTGAPQLPGAGGSIAENAVSSLPGTSSLVPSRAQAPSTPSLASLASHATTVQGASIFTAAQQQLYNILHAACASASYDSIVSTLSTLKSAVHVGGESTPSAGTQGGKQQEARDALGWVRPEHVREVARLHDPDHGATLLHVLAGSSSGDSPADETVESATEAVRALCASGALLDAPTANGATALHWAAGAGHVAMVKALLAAGADPLARTYTWRRQVFGKGSGQTPLHWAAESNHSAVVEILAERGPLAVACTDERGKTARDIATSEVSMSAVRALTALESEPWVILRVRQVASAMRPLHVSPSQGGREEGQGQLMQ